MSAMVSWLGEMRFRAVTESGHEIDIDSDGGTGPTPMECIINGLGGCASIDVIMILQKGRQQVTACRCELQNERAESSPRVFTKIHANFIVSGRDIALKQAERAVALSFDKYCSVAMMLNKVVDITHSVEVVEDQ